MNLSMAWVDYKKAYDMVHHSWFISRMGMVGLVNDIGLIKQIMNKWKAKFYANWKVLGSVRLGEEYFKDICVHQYYLQLIYYQWNMCSEEKERNTN